MPKKFFNRNTFSEETPIFDSKPTKNMEIYESQSIMQMIVEIKLQTEFEARYVKHLKPEKFKLEREESDSLQSKRNMNFDRMTNKKISKRSLPLKGKKLIESVIKEEFDENDPQIYPALLEKVMKRLIKSTQIVKNNFKRLKGLNVNEEFVFVNVHVCEYCGREFSKPCALGGHISKIHSQDRRKEQKMDENFDSPIPRVQ